MFLFPVPVGKIILGAACRVTCELESVHRVDTRHLVEHLFRGDIPVVRIHVVEPVRVNRHFVAPVVTRRIVAVVRAHHVDARVKHLGDKSLFVCVACGVRIADFVDVSPVNVWRNLLDAFLCVDGDVDSGEGQCCSTCDEHGGETCLRGERGQNTFHKTPF